VSSGELFLLVLVIQAFSAFAAVFDCQSFADSRWPKKEPNVTMSPATAAYLSIFTIAISVVIVIALNEGLRRLEQYRRGGRRAAGEPFGDGRPNPA
jgi:hypothetical protein